MKRETAFQVLGELDDRYIAEAYRYAPEKASDSPERVMHMKRKNILTFALAAVLILSLSISAYAGFQRVATPQAAERVAKEQIEVWKDMGLLVPEVEFTGQADRVDDLPEHNGGDRWYGRLFSHRFQVQWWGDEKYSCCLQIDTLSGKIMQATVNAKADETDEPVSDQGIEVEMASDPEHPEKVTFYLYDNFDDIFPADLTVDQFCSLLAEYWGFSGYTLAETVDSEYFDTPQAPVDPDSLLKDMPRDNLSNYYLTIFFEGDQEGAPMYLQLIQFPGYVTMNLGTGHAVG